MVQDLVGIAAAPVGLAHRPGGRGLQAHRRRAPPAARPALPPVVLNLDVPDLALVLFAGVGLLQVLPLLLSSRIGGIGG